MIILTVGLSYFCRTYSTTAITAAATTTAITTAEATTIIIIIILLLGLLQQLARSCLWRYGVNLRHSIRAMSGAPLSSSAPEEAL